MVPPIPQLTNNTNRPGGFLLRKLQQKWEKLITMHHLIRKTIYIVKNEPKWQNHPILQNLSNNRVLPVPYPTYHTQHGYKKLLRLEKMRKKTLEQ